MSLKQPCLGEAGASASSPKNAKDKNNSTTVEALHGCKHKDKSKGRSCSEKDSGFSDNSSDSKHTDEKDQCNKRTQRETKELSLNHNEPVKKSNRRNVIVAPSTQQLSSIYIIKNGVQPDIQKNAQVLWSSGAVPSVSGTNPIILLQPSTPPFSKSPGIPKSETTTKKINAANLPGTSYPRIAPRPHKKTPGKATSNGDSLTQSKRVCVESKSQSNRNPQEPHTHKPVPSTSQSSSNTPTPVTSTQPAPSASTATTTELNKTSVINTRHRRFLNTVQALKKTGLWDMTLRTKELMRQSNATRRDIAQLRQHSELLCQLTDGGNQNPSDQTATWLNLHKMMSESGCYPSLKNVQHLQAQTKQEAEVAKASSEESDKGSDGDKGKVTSDEASTDVTPLQTTKSREEESNETPRDKEAPPDSPSED